MDNTILRTNKLLDAIELIEAKTNSMFHLKYPDLDNELRHFFEYKDNYHDLMDKLTVIIARLEHAEIVRIL